MGKATHPQQGRLIYGVLGGDGMRLIEGLMGEASWTNSHCTVFALVTRAPDSIYPGEGKHLSSRNMVRRCLHALLTRQLSE